jgi:hypothetical protein
MNRHASMTSSRDDSWFSFFSHALIWLLLAAAGLLLAWFVAVLEDVTQRGEERRMKPRPAGALVLSRSSNGGTASACRWPPRAARQRWGAEAHRPQTTLRCRAMQVLSTSS